MSGKGIGADENHVYFTSGERKLVSRLLVGQFPEYEMVIPRNPQNRIVLDSGGLMEAVKRAALINDHRDRPVCLRFTKGSVSVSSEVADIGSAEESISAEYDGEDASVGFTSAILLDALNSAKGGRVSLEFNNINSQFLVKPVGGDLKKLDIVMPRRL